MPGTVQELNKCPLNQEEGEGEEGEGPEREPGERRGRRKRRRRRRRRRLYAGNGTKAGLLRRENKGKHGQEDHDQINRAVNNQRLMRLLSLDINFPYSLVLDIIMAGLQDMKN